MNPARINQAKADHTQLSDLTVLMNEACILSSKYPGNRELRKIAEDLRQFAIQMEQKFSEKYQDLIDQGITIGFNDEVPRSL